jgi:hypothetical protein
MVGCRLTGELTSLRISSSSTWTVILIWPTSVRSRCQGRVTANQVPTMTSVDRLAQLSSLADGPRTTLKGRREFLEAALGPPVDHAEQLLRFADQT